MSKTYSILESSPFVRLQSRIDAEVSMFIIDKLYAEIKQCYDEIEAKDSTCEQSTEAIKVLTEERDTTNRKYRSICEDMFTVLPDIIKMHNDMYNEMPEELRKTYNKAWSNTMNELETLYNAAKKEAQI